MKVGDTVRVIKSECGAPEKYNGKLGTVYRVDGNMVKVKFDDSKQYIYGYMKYELKLVEYTKTNLYRILNA